ncbi:MAG TPA: HAD family hydrolase [Candidatus Binatia bacterium]|jgi:HAD superfamily hydrolase (TIGR01509 family)|nr:HAD family hydrolase [Candidatus Binatia bacterium]
MPADLIIFDNDGVLVDSEPIVNRLFVEMLGELGHSLDYEGTLREFSGGTMAGRLAVIEPRLGWRAPAEFTAEYDRRLRARLARELRPIPGIRQVLSELSRPWCVASNAAPEDMCGRLGWAGLLADFAPPMFSATQVPRGKPAPDLFLYAAATMGAAPDRCVVVEDSVPGVQAAVAAGMPVLGFARLTSPDALRAAGAAVFDDMSLLPELVG